MIFLAENFQRKGRYRWSVRSVGSTSRSVDPGRPVPSPSSAQKSNVVHFSAAFYSSSHSRSPTSGQATRFAGSLFCYPKAPAPCNNGVSGRYPLGCRHLRYRFAAVTACFVWLSSTPPPSTARLTNVVFLGLEERFLGLGRKSST